MPTRATLRQYEYFVAAARAGSMVRASETMHVSPASVSLGIAQLERLLGVQLFVRAPHRPLALTAAGRELLDDAADVISRVETLEAGVQAGDAAVEGTVHLACFTTLGPTIIPRLVDEARSKHPGLRVEAQEVDTDRALHGLFDATFELALLYDVDLSAGLEHETIARFTPYVVVHEDHRLAGSGTVELRQLARDPLILLDAPPSREHTLSVLDQCSVRPRVERVTRGFETLRSLVARGHGWGLLVQRSMSDVTYEGLRVVPLEIADEVTPVSVVAAQPAGARRSPRVQACIDACHRAAIAAAEAERPDASGEYAPDGQ